MSRAEFPGSPPPDIPEEFAEAYRRAYEEELERRTAHPGSHRADVPAVSEEPDPGVAEDVGAHVQPQPEPEPEPARPPAYDENDEVRDRARQMPERSTEYVVTPQEHRSTRMLTWLLLLGLAALLIVGAYVVARSFASGVGDDPGPTETPTVVMTEGSDAG